MMNGHFASVGEEGTKEQYAHGVQVVDEDKAFKYGSLAVFRTASEPPC